MLSQQIFCYDIFYKVIHAFWVDEGAKLGHEHEREHAHEHGPIFVNMKGYIATFQVFLKVAQGISFSTGCPRKNKFLKTCYPKSKPRVVICWNFLCKARYIQLFAELLSYTHCSKVIAHHSTLIAHHSTFIAHYPHDYISPTTRLIGLMACCRGLLWWLEVLLGRRVDNNWLEVANHFGLLPKPSPCHFILSSSPMASYKSYC